MADLASVLAGLKGGMGASVAPAERERMLMMGMGQGQPNMPPSALADAMMGMGPGAQASGAAMPDPELERYQQMQQGEMIGGAPPVASPMMGAMGNEDVVLSEIMGLGAMAPGPEAAVVAQQGQPESLGQVESEIQRLIELRNQMSGGGQAAMEGQSPEPAMAEPQAAPQSDPQMMQHLQQILSPQELEAVMQDPQKMAEIEALMQQQGLMGGQ